MGVPNEAFQADEVYIDFPQEFMFFRWHKATGKVFRRFYDDPAEDEIHYSSGLFRESQSYGTVTTKEAYLGRGRLPDAGEVP